MLLLAAPLQAEGASLGEARELWLTGKHAEAEEQYESLVKEPDTAVAAAIGLSRCFESVGEWDKAA
jgi:hypothetical protein